MDPQFLQREIAEALQKAATDFGKQEMAVRLDKAPSTFYNEMNPYCDRAKLGVGDAMSIMGITGDLTALHLMCTAFGLEARPVGAEPVVDEAALARLAQVVDNVGALAGELVQGIADGRLSREERLALFEKAKGISQSLAPFLVVG